MTRRPDGSARRRWFRYKTNDYSVPVAYGHRDVWVRGYIDRVVIGCGGEIVARHPRCYDREDMVFDPIHYLPLLKKKIGALDQAAPLAGWDLPPEFQTLRRLMEARMIKAGRREVRAGAAAAGDLRARRPACRGEDRAAHGRRRLRRRQAPGALPGREAPPKLDLDVYPYLPRATVARTSAASYMCLVSGNAA